MSNGKESLSPSEMDPKDLPDVPAFQDELTRDYLESTEPVREGYYTLKSATNTFTLDFPEDMVVDETSMAGNEGNSESLIFYYDDNDADVMDQFIINYYSSIPDIEYSRDLMNRRAGEELDFKKVPSENENQHLEIAEMDSDDSTSYIAAIVRNESKQEIQVFTSIICREDIENNQCDSLKEEEKEKVSDVLKSIQFNNDKGK
ncbi:hypothetical protein [Terribacillus halophilus]|uniref:hypothetical protein n=1 Tax=Terribacillus halophilus TaxID=361279 RepID=UPI00098654BD|nr:hypothetical protein [Terribacillus halophilus]